MFALFLSLAIGTLLISILGALYAVPIRRTWRKEHGQSPETPGPEVGPLEPAATGSEADGEVDTERLVAGVPTTP